MTNSESNKFDSEIKRMGHTIQGLISFFLAIALLTTLLALIVYFGPVNFWAMRKHMEIASAPIVLGCGTAVGYFIVMVGIGLGLSGLAKPDSSRFYSILGIVGNAVWALIIGLLILID